VAPSRWGAQGVNNLLFLLKRPAKGGGAAPSAGVGGARRHPATTTGDRRGLNIWRNFTARRAGTPRPSRSTGRAITIWETLSGRNIQDGHRPEYWRRC